MTEETTTERRASQRFPIEVDVRYWYLGSRGDRASEVYLGKSVNVGSHGALFLAQEPVLPGQRITLSLSWPVRLGGQCKLKLEAEGRVVWCRGNWVAMEIRRSEFRTTAAQGPSLLSRLQKLHQSGEQVISG